MAVSFGDWTHLLNNEREVENRIKGTLFTQFLMTFGRKTVKKSEMILYIWKPVKTPKIAGRIDILPDEC